MSHFYSPNFYPVDEFAFDYSLATNQEASTSPRRFLGDISISFESAFTSGFESTGLSTHPAHCRHFASDTHSQGLVPHNSTFLTEDTPGYVGIMPPLASDTLPTTSLTTHSPAKLATKKRTVNHPKQKASTTPKKVSRKWEKVDYSFSTRQSNGEAEYRCDICHKSKKKVITASYADMLRHLQSWAH